MPRPCSNFSLEIRIIISEPEFKKTCLEPQKCSHCGKKGHLAKDCWEKYSERKLTANQKPKLNLPSLVEEVKVEKKVEERRKEEKKETSFEELMGKKNKMTKI